jgi:tryptophan synthase beta chain
MIDRYPDVVVSCLGGGSNFGGIALPFLGDVLTRGKKTRFLAAQSQSAPNLQGKYRYDNADYSGLTPRLKMYTLGHKKEMPPIFGDGLRYHGCSPILSLLRNRGYIDTVAYPVDEKYVFESAKTFLSEEGFLPAPESAYSVAAAIDEATRCKESGQRKVILFNISGHGFMDMEGYRQALGM